MGAIVTEQIGELELRSVSSSAGSFLELLLTNVEPGDSEAGGYSFAWLSRREVEQLRAACDEYLGGWRS